MSSSHPKRRRIDEKKKIELLSLPNDVLLCIFIYLDHWSLYQVIKAVSKESRVINIASYPKLWIHVDFDDGIPSSKDLKIIFHQYLHEKTKSLRCLGSLKADKNKKTENISSHLLEKLSQKCPNLETLILDYHYIDGNRIKIFDIPSSIENLSLCHSEIVNSSANKTSYFKETHTHLKHLRILKLDGCCWIPNHSLLALCKIESLEELSLRGCFRIGECFAYTALATRFGFQNIKKIDVRDTSIGDSEIPCFGRLPKITHAYFGRESNLPPIPIISEGDGKITDRGIASLIEDPSKITHLSLRETEMTDKLLQLLGKRLALKFLDVRCTKVSLQAVAQFKANYPLCQLIADSTS